MFLYDERERVSSETEVCCEAKLRQDVIRKHRYEANEATPERMPQERSPRSARAGISSGESLSAGIMWKSVTLRAPASSRASMLISCRVSMCSVRNDMGITSMRLTPSSAMASMVPVSEGCNHFCGPTLLWKHRTCGLGQAPS